MRMSTRLPSLLPTLVLGYLAGSCTNKDPATLIISGTGFATELEGFTFKIGVVDVDGKKIVETATGTITNGKISASIEVDPDTTYRADIFVDTDNDGHCQFGVDSVYAIAVPGLSGGSMQTFTINPSLVDSQGCLAWGGSTLHATLSNFTASGTVYKAVLTRTDGPKRLQLKTGAVTGGTITLDFAGAMIPGHFYQLDIYIDNNGDDQCIASVDSVFSKTSTSLPPPQRDGLTGDTVPLLLDGELNAASSCANF